MAINLRHTHFNRCSPKKVDSDFASITPRSKSSEYPLLTLTACAVALPMMCAYQQPPLPAFFNQALALALWCGVLLLLAMTARGALLCNNSGISRLVTPVNLWALLLATVAAHAAVSLTPVFIAAPIALNLALALLVTAAMTWIAPSQEQLKRWLQALLLGILIAALFNSWVALVQSVAPNWADDSFIARLPLRQDRVVGNLRQPNQLATLMVWGLLATSFFWRRQPLLWIVFSAPLLATLAATGSRTGMISLLLIVVVALLRSRRVRAWRVKGWLALLLAALPLLWIAESIFTRSTAHVALTLRLALWRDTLEIISQHPWFGVGWGQLNFAWTLTPLAHRAADVFDHAHSLPLHLAVELGLPIATLTLGLLGALLWRVRNALQSSHGATAVLLLATVLLHSFFEYPLWFSYFLLPSAFLLAWLVSFAKTDLDAAATSVEVSRAAWLGNAFKVMAVLSLAGVVYACIEYQKAVNIHRAVGQSTALTSAINTAQQSPLFGHFGDYAAIMLAADTATSSLFIRPIRHVLDERLLSAYARMLARAGKHDRARFVVERAREFPPDAAFGNLPSVTGSAPALNAGDFRR